MLINEPLNKYNILYKIKNFAVSINHPSSNTKFYVRIKLAWPLKKFSDFFFKNN